jgi:hypothetical protein
MREQLMRALIKNAAASPAPAQAASLGSPLGSLDWTSKRRLEDAGPSTEAPARTPTEKVSILDILMSRHRGVPSAPTKPMALPHKRPRPSRGARSQSATASIGHSPTAPSPRPSRRARSQSPGQGEGRRLVVAPPGRTTERNPSRRRPKMSRRRAQRPWPARAQIEPRPGLRRHQRPRAEARRTPGLATAAPLPPWTTAAPAERPPTGHLTALRSQEPPPLRA